MTPLRRRMLADLPRRGLSERTQEMSVRAVRPLAEPYHTSPDRLTAEALRDDCLSRNNVTHDSRRATTSALCGRQFCSTHTWRRDWTTLTGVRPPREKPLPVLLSPAAGRTLLACVRRPRDRVCLATLSSGGLRLHAGTPRQVSALDAARLRIHVRQGKGAKDRDCPPASTQP